MQDTIQDQHFAKNTNTGTAATWLKTVYAMNSPTVDNQFTRAKSYCLSCCLCIAPRVSWRILKHITSCKGMQKCWSSYYSRLLIVHLHPNQIPFNTFLAYKDLEVKWFGIDLCGEIHPLHLTHPNYWGAVRSHSSAPGEQFWGQWLGQGQSQWQECS